MAIQLSHTLPSGVSGDHWVVTKIEGDLNNGGVGRATLALYVDAAQFAVDPDSPIYATLFVWVKDDYPFKEADLDPANKNQYKAAYDAIITEAAHASIGGKVIDFTDGVKV